MTSLTLQRLNGWQRLFVVAAVLWLVPVGAVLVAQWPTKAEITGQWVDAYIEQIVQNTNELKSYSTWQVRNAYRDISDEELLKRLEQKYSSSVPLERIELNYRRRLDSLLMDQASTGLLGFAAWLLPLIAAYLLGMAIAWIRSGFERGNRRDA